MQILVFGFGGTDNANTLIDESFVFWGWWAMNIFDIIFGFLKLLFYPSSAFQCRFTPTESFLEFRI